MGLVVIIFLVRVVKGSKGVKGNYIYLCVILIGKDMDEWLGRDW